MNLLNIQSFLGGYTIGQFLSLFAWALIGAYILVQFHINQRDPASKRTPVKFSWGFWFEDNVRRTIFNGVLIFVTLRFSKEVTGRQLNEFWALVIGLSSDGLAQLINTFRIVKLSGTAKPIDKENTP